ncbi:MAG: hypothetical protein ACFE9S_00560 [Candidatus Hermodarchaeota archaeon]
MKKIKKLVAVILSIFTVLISCTTNVLSTDYHYRVYKGEEHIWTVMVGNPAILLSQGSKFRVIIEENYNGTWIEDFTYYSGTILNYSIEVYSTFYTNPTWDLLFNGSVIFFNETTRDLFTAFTTDWHIALFGMLFFVPTPVNLTWIGDYLKQTSLILFNDYNINGNTLVMQNVSSNIDFTFDFNENGTLTEYKVSSGASIGYHIKYGNIQLGNQIPFGNLYLIFIPSTIIIIILWTQYKLRKREF